MFQVDIFLAVGIGACFALMAAPGLKRSQSPFYTKYFISALSYVGIVFVPSGMYLFWKNVGWETMFMFDYSLHGIWVALFAQSIFILAAMGYALAAWALKSGRQDLGHLLWTLMYCCVFGIVSFNYDRFAYPGKIDDWKNGVVYPLESFLFSDIYIDLTLMCIYALPPLYYPMLFWPGEFGITADEKKTLITATMKPYFAITSAVSLAYFLLFAVGLVPSGWGLDRLLAYLAGQAWFGFLGFLPLFILSVGPVSEHTKSG